MKTIDILDFEIFSDPDIGVVHFTEIDGELWWLLSSVCNILVLNPFVEYLDDNEKMDVFVQGTESRHQDVLINETGLYKIISRPDKPKAELLMEWIIHEVIPDFWRQKEEQETFWKYMSNPSARSAKGA